LKVIVAKNSGFCFGVKRAMEMAYKYAKEHPDKKKYSLREIIHNSQEVKKLEAEGVKHIEKISDIEDGACVIVSTHGVTPTEKNRLKEKHLNILDTTCPYVKKIHLIVKHLAESGAQVVIVGDKDHLEVSGIVGYAQAPPEGKGVSVISEIEEVKKMRVSAQIGVVAQTTYNLVKYMEITKAIMEKAFAQGYAQVSVHNTICDATYNRQEETIKIAKQAEIMIVVGGKNSANTKRLYSLSREILKTVYHIETAGELKASWFKGKKIVGVSAGASTPDSAIAETVKKINEIGRKHK